MTLYYSTEYTVQQEINQKEEKEQCKVLNEIICLS